MSCFKAYDIRGRLGEELNETIAERIGYALVKLHHAKRVVLGCDVRPTSRGLLLALARGMNHAGAEVVDLGLTGSEEVYFASQVLDVDLGVEVTASHNPIEYNGMKCVRRGGIAMGYETGLSDVEAMIQSFELPSLSDARMMAHDITNQYIDHLMTYVKAHQWKPMRILVNAGHGAAGHVIDAIEQRFRDMAVPVTFIKIHHEPDGSFPVGIPNPMIPKNREITADAVKQYQADIGIAWDGDFDRCFIFDHEGLMVEGHYMVALLAQAFLMQKPGATIVYDPRLIWSTEQVLKTFNGHGMMHQSGHSFIKSCMRKHDALFGGESSAHYYFKAFGYCDSGMIPWLMVVDLLQHHQVTLQDIVSQDRYLFPCSGELNYRLNNAQEAMNTIDIAFSKKAKTKNTIDGLSFDLGSWRFNVRQSNTEPLLRLNIESQANTQLVQDARAQIESILEPFLLVTKGVDETP